ncbi:MAG: T9SS type A sorting domain-containing protein [Winogradskyella arenosi]
MKKLLLTLFANFGIISMLVAQGYTTPDTGVTYSLDDLVALSPSTLSVSNGVYTLTDDLSIAASDALLIASDATIEIGADVLISVSGNFTVSADNVVFTAIDPAMPYEGFRFEQLSVITISNATIQYGGGLRVLTETFSIDNCLITNNVSGAATGGVIALSRGQAQITNNTITFNDTPAISSGANSDVSPYIFNNYIEGNNQTNNNRPQINLGTTLASSPLQIIQNTIIGDRALDQVGAIAVSNFFGATINAIIDDNIINNNRYGISILGGNSFAYIRNNIIEDNDTQGSPNLGGSGISLNSPSATMEVIASGNEIRRNLWGITVIDEASINLGDGVDNVGQNVFSENGNGGTTYALYNNTGNALMAMNNCWDEENTPNTLVDAEAVIVHANDISTLGLVTFDPVNCGFLSVDDVAAQTLHVFPNPATDVLNIAGNTSFNNMHIYTIDGKLIMKRKLQVGDQTVALQLQTGVYILEFTGGTTKMTQKLVIQ